MIYNRSTTFAITRETTEYVPARQLGVRPRTLFTVEVEFSPRIIAKVLVWLSTLPSLHTLNIIADADEICSASITTFDQTAFETIRAGLAGAE
jgi:hypothetical protein